MMATILTPIAPKQDRSVATRERLLDAAVDELLASGYAGLTTSAVSNRAGVSRGAQQHHFPHKELLIAEAIRHLAERQIAELETVFESAPRGRVRAQHALDAIYAAYSGPLFAATVELSLASHHEPSLEPIIREHERAISRTMTDAAADIFAAEVRASPGFSSRWATALGAARGIAMLRLLGHPAHAVDRQWASARRVLMGVLFESVSST